MDLIRRDKSAAACWLAALLVGTGCQVFTEDDAVQAGLADAGIVDELPPTDAAQADAVDPSLGFLIAEPSQIRLGEAVTISYSIPETAAYCRSPNGIAIQGTGSSVVYPTRSMNYEIDCPGGPTPLIVRASVQVIGADPSGLCGSQRGELFADSDRLREASSAEVDGQMIRMRSPAGDAVVCAIECDGDWLSAQLWLREAGAEPRALSLPATLGDRTWLQLQAPAGAVGSATCRMTTSAGDPEVLVEIVAAS